MQRIRNFNSIKVRLEHLLLKKPSTLSDYFNSIKVRLELPYASKVVAVVGFQFHKGAIRTRLDTSRNSRKKLFQFHKGAIRTIIIYISAIWLKHFNSIKVRLEPENGGAAKNGHYYFNSIKVRLELSSRRVSMPGKSISIP